MNVTLNTIRQPCIQPSEAALPVVRRSDFPFGPDVFKWVHGTVVAPVSCAPHFPALIAGRHVGQLREVLVTQLQSGVGEPSGHFVVTYNPRLHQIDPNFITSIRQVQLVE